MHPVPHISSGRPYFASPLNFSGDMYTPKLWEDYIRYVGGFAKERGIPFLLPKHEECGLSNVDFSDLHHLTEAGQMKFSKCLRPMLETVTFP